MKSTFKLENGEVITSISLPCTLPLGMGVTLEEKPYVIEERWGTAVRPEFPRNVSFEMDYLVKPVIDEVVQGN